MTGSAFQSTPSFREPTTSDAGETGGRFARQLGTSSLPADLTGQPASQSAHELSSRCGPAG